VLAPITV